MPTEPPLPTYFTAQAGKPVSGLAWLLAVAGHALLVGVVYAVLYAFGVLHNAPSEESLFRWDAGWYDSIRSHGYRPSSTEQSNLAFFPLFPYLWRVLGANIVGISAINASLLLLSGAWLGRTFGLRRHQVLLLLSVPSLFFCFVPYTEALFFFFGVILLRGLHRSQVGLTVVGLLGCCLVRSAATLFVPAFVLAEVLACTTRAELPHLAKRLGAGLLAIAAGLGLVMYLHYQAAHDPLAFFSAQKYWAHELRWPLPPRLRSSAGVPVIGFDLLALFTGLLALLASLGLGIRWLRSWRRAAPLLPPSRAVIFALCYCGGMAAVVLLYQENDLANCSRYILATPYFAVLVAQLPRWQRLKSTSRWLLAGLAVAVAGGVAIWCGWPVRFPGFFPGEANFFFACWATYIGLYVMAFSTGTYNREVRTGLYIVNVVCQVVFLDFFLGGVWMG